MQICFHLNSTTWDLSCESFCHLSLRCCTNSHFLKTKCNLSCTGQKGQRALCTISQQSSGRVQRSTWTTAMNHSQRMRQQFLLPPQGSWPMPQREQRYVWNAYHIWQAEVSYKISGMSALCWKIQFYSQWPSRHIAFQNLLIKLSSIGATGHESDIQSIIAQSLSALCFKLDKATACS